MKGQRLWNVLKHRYQRQTGQFRLKMLKLGWNKGFFKLIKSFLSFLSPFERDTCVCQSMQRVRHFAIFRNIAFEIGTNSYESLNFRDVCRNGPINNGRDFVRTCPNTLSGYFMALEGYVLLKENTFGRFHL